LKTQEFNEPSGPSIPHKLYLGGSEISSYFNLWDRDVNPASSSMEKMFHRGINL
jgi:hypothetical protein